MIGELPDGLPGGLTGVDVPASAVPLAEVARLLGYPAGRELDDRVREAVAATRAWCAREGRAWSVLRMLGVERISGTRVEWRGGAAETRGCFDDRGLARELARTQADGMIALACSAGPELAARARERAAAGDALGAFVCDHFGAAWVEALVRAAGIRVGRELAARGRALTRPRSPGLGGWDLEEQARVFACFGAEVGPLALLDSGMLRPLNSKLAVFGTTRKALPADPAAWVPCSACSLVACEHRRSGAPTVTPA